MRIAAFVALVTLVACVSTRVELVDRWNLYAASGPGQPYRLFLGPFPDARTCQAESAAIARTGGLAHCSDRLVLSLDRSREDQLVWEFVATPWRKLCGNLTPASSKV
jgi:hypothetical protein